MKIPKKTIARTLLVAGVVALVLAAGHWIAQLQTAASDRELRTALYNQANGLARTIDPELVNALDWDGTGDDKPAFKRITEQLTAYRDILGCRGIYTLVQCDGQLRFGPESYATDDPLASPPGTIYQNPDANFVEIFQTKRPFVCGPITDEYGTFISAAAPVFDPRSGKLLMVVGLDLEADQWQALIRQKAIQAWGVTLGLTLVLLMGAAVTIKYTRRVHQRDDRFGYTEPCMIALLGIALTAMLALYLHNREIRTHRDLFEHLAQTQANRVTNAFQNIYTRQLGVLTQFFNGSESVSRREFASFTRPLIANSSLRALEWIAAVPATEKKRWENRARAEGLPGYTIWQTDPHHGLPPSAGRDTLYPVWYAEPLAGNETALGFDQGSEPDRCDAMDQARQSGLATATRPVTLAEIDRNQPGLLVYYPVYADSDNRSTLKGYTLAVLCLETTLQTLLANGNDAGEFAILDMYHIHKDQAHLLLASSSTRTIQRHRFETGGFLNRSAQTEALYAMYPLFLFGQSYALAIHPGPAFLDAHHPYAGWTTALTGLLMTGLLTGLAVMIIRRRQHLESQVRIHTTALRFSEARYRQLAELFPETIFEADLNGRITYMNRNGCLRYGYTESDIARGINVIHTVFPEDRTLIAIRLQERLDSNQSGYSEYRAITKSGAVFQALAHSAPILREGRPIGYCGFVLDISKQKHTEDSLVHQRILLESIVNAIPIPLFYKGPDGVYLGCNQAFADFLGVPRSEIAGQTVFELAPPELAERYDRADKELIGSGSNQVYETEVVYAGASRHQVIFHKALFRDPDGAIAGIVGAMLDITERKRMENALRDRENRIHALTNSARDAIIMMDPLGKITFWNPAAETILGYRRSEALGSDLHQLITPPRYRSQYQKALDTFRQHGSGAALGRTLELMAQPKTGPEIAISLSLSMVKLEGQYHAVGILRDITEQKKAEQELRDLNEYLTKTTACANRMALDAASATQAKSEFLANMSHEIRTPMNGIVGIVQLLLESSLDAEQRQYAEIIRSSGDALLALINEILDFSKIEAGKLELTARDFHLPTVMAEVAGLLEHKANEKDLKLTSRIDPDIPTDLRGDSGRLRQILLNLGGNAVKFTHQGRVDLEVGLIGATETGVSLRFKVTDTGIGIPADRQHRLFTPFTQIDGSTTRQYGGTGLGLSISKQLVELMGGAMGLASQNGQGSTFWFTVHFELASPKPVPIPESPPPTLSPPDKSQTSRILLVEDNRTNQIVALKILEKLGYCADTASNGAEAIAILLTTGYDLILMDCQMPVLGGVETTRQIRAGAAGPAAATLPIIAMTANAMNTDRQNCLNAGMNDYLSKPVHPQALAETLEKWLRRPDTPAQVPAGPDSHPAFDPKTLPLYLDGDESFRNEIITLFLKDIPQQIDILKTSLQTGDSPRVLIQTHTIKGAAATIGGNALRQVAATMEKQCRADQLADAAALLPELEEQFNTLRHTIQTLYPLLNDPPATTPN